MRNRFNFCVSVMALALLLGGCGNAREQLGLNKSAPDEFAVVKRAPLAMPPNYSLRPPQPGAPRPQEQAPSQTAQRAVFGETTSDSGYVASSEGESALLQEAGATSADPNIRGVVDSESTEIDNSNKPVVDRLLGWRNDEQEASVVNARKEAERLQNKRARASQTAKRQA